VVAISVIVLDLESLNLKIRYKFGGKMAKKKKYYVYK
jgi:hypothetical protein